MRTLAAVLMLVLASCTGHPAFAGKAADPYADLRATIEARLPDLNAYVRAVTGYTVPGLPKLVIKTPKEINQIYFAENYDGQETRCDEWCVLAVFFDGVMFIGSDFEPVRDDFILVHELTHWQQFASGVQMRCIGEFEAEAYKVHDTFVDATGQGIKSDPITVASMLGACFE
jgi:hypothetical protein